jgi:phosphoribosylaminoimidazole (AIR) synthetase
MTFCKITVTKVFITCQGLTHKIFWGYIAEVMAQEFLIDDKGSASLTLGQVIEETRDNFQDPRFRPEPVARSAYYHHFGIKTHPYGFTVTVDGTGTKPELAERQVTSAKKKNAPVDYYPYSNLAFDVFAMVESDIARFGRFVLGVANVVDTNKATPEVTTALAQGMRLACDTGKFALLNGETAELKHRTSGYGDERINWNAFGVALINPEKELLGAELEPGQPLVAVREYGIRSNGLTLAREILEADYLRELGYVNKEEYFMDKYREHLVRSGIIKAKRDVYSHSIIEFLDQIMGHNFLEQVLPPWHESHSETVNKLLSPSVLFSPLMYAAQGGVDGPRPIEMTGAAHISGGGIPGKMKRMVEPKGLGARVEVVFPEPEAITNLLEIGKRHEEKTGEILVTEQKASENWGRGIGFVVATKTMNDADELVKMADKLGYEAKIAGEIIDRPEVDFKGIIWKDAA